MNRGNGAAAKGRFHNTSTIARHARRRTENRFRGGGTETGQDRRFDQSEFRFEPWTARGNVARSRGFMEPSFSTRLPFEMFHRVCDVNDLSIDPSFLERAVEQLAGWPDKRFPLQILLVAGLFADKNNLRIFGSLPENRLSGVFVKRTSGAFARRIAQPPQIAGRRDRRGMPLVIDRAVDTTFRNHCLERERDFGGWMAE